MRYDAALPPFISIVRSPGGPVILVPDSVAPHVNFISFQDAENGNPKILKSGWAGKFGEFPILVVLNLVVCYFCAEALFCTLLRPCVCAFLRSFGCISVFLRPTAFRTTASGNCRKFRDMPQKNPVQGIRGIHLGVPVLVIWGSFLGEMRMPKADMLGAGVSFVWDKVNWGGVPQQGGSIFL